MSMEHSWNDTGMEKLKYTKVHFIHHKSYLDWLKIEPGPPRWKGGD